MQFPLILNLINNLKIVKLVVAQRKLRAYRAFKCEKLRYPRRWEKEMMLRNVLLIWLLIPFGCSNATNDQGMVERIIEKHISVTCRDRNGNLPETLESEIVEVDPSKDKPLTLRTRIHYPNKMRDDGINDDLILSSGSNGKDVWTVEVNGKVTVEKGRFRKEMLEIYSEVRSIFWNYKENGYAVKLLGTEKIGNTECYKIHVRKPSNSWAIVFIDCNTFLMIKKSSYSPDSERPDHKIFDSYFSDYRDVGGIPTCFKEVIDEGSQKKEFKAKWVKYNVELDDSIFDVPQEADFTHK